MIPKIKSMCSYSKSWLGIKYPPSTAAVSNMLQVTIFSNEYNCDDDDDDDGGGG